MALSSSITLHNTPLPSLLAPSLILPFFLTWRKSRRETDNDKRKDTFLYVLQTIFDEKSSPNSNSQIPLDHHIILH